MTRPTYSAMLACLLLAILAVSAEDELLHREKRQNNNNNNNNNFFSVFQIMKFPNDACMGSGNRNGTCFTNAECQERGGENAGGCADNFGVCCVFTIGCGQMTSENCTIFEATNPSVGACNGRVCPCTNNICQLRLDFSMFVINGPQTTSTADFKQVNGIPSTTAAAISASLQGNCLTDAFTVTNPGGASPPVICGTNNGQHMYVDSSNSCNDLNFQFGNQAMGAASVTRQFSIKVTQISCDSEMLAPDGCTQYFTGSTTGQIETFNFNSGMGQHLANQDQSFCIRRERGFCRACFSAIATTDFMVSGPVATSAAGGMGTQCGQYGADGKGVVGFDFFNIPRGMDNAGAVKFTRYCGRKKLSAQGTRCTTVQPFVVRFTSDAFEISIAAAEAATPDLGFRVGYFMDAINC